MTEEILAFATWAATYVSGAIVWAGMIGIPLSVPLLIWYPRAVPLLLTTLFAVFLTLLPFPDPDTFDCATSVARVIVKPFEGLRGVVRAIAATGQYWRLLTDLTVMSSIMNVVFFMLPGAALTLLLQSAAGAAAYGLCLSLAIETTQYTGNLGWYDCAYRYADVTDLMTNTLGVWLGFLLARRIMRTVRTRRNVQIRNAGQS